jgi:hypothetical protein
LIPHCYPEGVIVELSLGGVKLHGKIGSMELSCADRSKKFCKDLVLAFKFKDTT